MKADDIVTAVRRHYGCDTDGLGPEWAALAEMALRPGHSPTRIDVLCIRAWGGKPKGHERHAIEVKVSRGDLKRELDSGKWEPWAAVCHRFYLAIPASMGLNGVELPDEWGVLRVHDGGFTRCDRKAPRNDDPNSLPEPTTVEAFRRASRMEARLRHADDGDRDALIVRLRQDVQALERQIETANAAEDRWQTRAKKALEMFATVAPDVHCQCGTRLRFSKRPWKRHAGPEWEHDGEPGPDPMPYRGNDGAPCRWAKPDWERLAEVVTGVTA